VTREGVEVRQNIVAMLGEAMYYLADDIATGRSLALVECQREFAEGLVCRVVEMIRRDPERYGHEHSLSKLR
jgi:hypothetical protein